MYSLIKHLLTLPP